jgi:TRAP-type mannitol/chloroaromatic compound transport system permease large subunit
MRKFQAAYSNNVFGGLVTALVSPSRALAIETPAGRVTYWMLLSNLAYALVPFLIVAGTLALTWWYVVIHPQVGPEVAVEGVQQLGTPDIAQKAPTDSELGPPASFYWSFGAIVIFAAIWQIRYYMRLDADRLEVIKLLSSSIMPLGLLTVVVLGVILFGITTATESAGVGAAGAFLLAFQAKTLDWKRTKEAVFLTAKTTAMVCWLFVGSALFSGVFAILGGQALVEQWVLSLNLTPIQFMILSQAIIFLLGWPFEWPAIVFIFLPMLAPVAKGLGYDMVWFGCIVAVVLQTAFLSPPVAMSAYYLKQVVKEWNLRLIYRGMADFMVLQVACVALVLIFPAIAMWFPQWLQARRIAARTAQIEQVAPPQSAAAALDGPRLAIRTF